MGRLRKPLTWALLTFVIFSAGFAVGKEVGARRALADRPAGASDAVRDDRPHAIEAWYFHSPKRCKKCNTIEAFSKETLETRFGDALADGTISWHTANMGDVLHQEAVERYGLIRSSLVLVEIADGQEVDHTVLNRTWDLTDKHDYFLDYVESEVEMIVDGWSEDELEEEE